MATPTELQHQDAPRAPSTGMHVHPAPTGVRPTAWQLVLWRLLAFVAHMMRPAAPDARSNMALNRYLRRHPVRCAAYAVAAFAGALLVMALLALPAMPLLKGLHLRPRRAPDFGVTWLAVCGVCALCFTRTRSVRAGSVRRNKDLPVRRNKDLPRVG